MSAFYLNFLGSGARIHVLPQQTMTRRKTKKMTDHGATVKKGRVVTWLDVTTDHVRPSGFTWNVLESEYHYASFEVGTQQDQHLLEQALDSFVLPLVPILFSSSLASKFRIFGNFP